MKVKKGSKSSWISNCFKIHEEPVRMIREPEIEKKVEPEPIKSPNSTKRISYTDINSSTLSEDLSTSLAGSNLYVFNLAELKVITQSFSSCNFLGEGGFGPVHKGFIDDKLRPGLKAQPVAVKVLNIDGGQGHREWLVRIYTVYILVSDTVFYLLKIYIKHYLHRLYRQKLYSSDN